MVERVALVTGAARGIGAATTRRLAEQGYGVLALDWCLGDASPASYPMGTREELTAVAAGYDEVVDLVVDVRDEDALKDAVAHALDRWGRLDAVVAGAAVVAGGGQAWETPADELDLMWAVGVRGVWNTAVAAIPAMLAGPDPSGCRVVAIASAAGGDGLHGLAAYASVKHAVVGLVKGLAADLTDTGVTAVAVSPGSTRTAMLGATAGLYGIADVEHFARNQLLGRLLEPEEVAEVVAFCCSRAGGVLDGDVVHADGGFRP
jgi:SDR family mycofactocin-dependent oxidoreductase